MRRSRAAWLRRGERPGRTILDAAGTAAATVRISASGVTLSAFDPDGDVVTLSVTGLPGYGGFVGLGAGQGPRRSIRR